MTCDMKLQKVAVATTLDIPAAPKKGEEEEKEEHGIRNQLSKK